MNQPPPLPRQPPETPHHVQWHGKAELTKLPFSLWWPLLCGVLAGIAMRLMFSGKPGSALAAMSGAFIYLSPLLVGMVTVYVAERQWRRSWYYYFVAPFVANVFYVLGTLLIMVEGLICAILIVPLFATLGAVGGVIMGVICRSTNWPKQSLYSFAALPLVFALAGQQTSLPEHVDSVERRLLIDAAPEQVWRNLWEVRDIRPEEVDSAWMYRIGVPLPKAGISQQTPTGLVRRITMGKGIHFDQVVTQWQPARYVHWTYRFDEHSFPPRALDDHVKIGGHYFDLRGTSYTLIPRGKATELVLRMDYRVSTQFNWYADPIAQWLMGDFEETILAFYRRRSEAMPPVP